MNSPAYRVAISLAKGLSWLFTDWRGLSLLGLGALLLLSLRMIIAARRERCLRKAAGEGVGPLSGIDAALAEAASLLAWAASNLPALVMSAAILALLAALSTAASGLDDFLSNQKRISAYEKVVANLERRYRLARVDCLGSDQDGLSLRLGYYDAEGNAVVSTQDARIPGHEVFFDALVLNFAYSGIESGAARNLALPRALFSDRLAEKDGILLKAADAQGLPYLYERKEDQVYGLDKAEFDARLGEILSCARDEAAARKAGVVRSLYGSAVHRSLSPGQSFTVWVEESGGLSIKDGAF